MQIPKSATKYILLQRTEYAKFSNNKLIKKLRRHVPTLSLERLAAIEACFRKKSIAESYSKDIACEYSTIRNYLPASCIRVLDIGCGVAGIDATIQEHYAGKEICFYLLDRTVIDKNIVYGYRGIGAFYNSLTTAKLLLTQNGIRVDNVILVEATEANDVAVDGPIDLVVSLISWGFHYPVSTYLNQVHSKLSERGVLILDVRKNTNGMEELAAKFSRTTVICEREKYVRLCCQK